MRRPDGHEVFTRHGAWDGGDYELAILLAAADHRTLGAANDAVWAFPDLEGCYARADLEPEDQVRIAPRVAYLDGTLHGRAKLPNGAVVPCSTVTVERGGAGAWLYFGLPLGSLEHVHPINELGGDRAPGPWKEELDAWLCAIARSVFERVQFRLALVGREHDEDDTVAMLDPKGVPDWRWSGYLVPSRDSLEWHPPNQPAPKGLSPGLASAVRRIRRPARPRS